MSFISHSPSRTILHGCDLFSSRLPVSSTCSRSFTLVLLYVSALKKLKRGKEKKKYFGKNSRRVRTRGREDAIYLIYRSINIPNLYRRHNSFVLPLFVFLFLSVSLSPTLCLPLRPSTSSPLSRSLLHPSSRIYHSLLFLFVGLVPFPFRVSR